MKRILRPLSPGFLLIALVLYAVLFMLSGCDSEANHTLVYLVRHAEKIDDSSNPPLKSPEGTDRALALKEELRTIDLDAIYVSQYQRTHQTAEPTALVKGIIPDTIPDTSNQALVNHILANHSGGSVLVSAHSHTIKDILEKLGVEQMPTIYPPYEYDKLFLVIHNDKTGKSGVIMGEYGAQDPPPTPDPIPVPTGSFPSSQ